MKTTLLRGLLLGCLACGPALAQTPTLNLPSANGATAPVAPVALGCVSSFANGVTVNPCPGSANTNPSYVSDPNNASIGASGTARVVVTVGTPYAVGRTIQFNCTTGGTVTFTEGGQSVLWIIPVGTTELSHATTAVTSIGSAVCPQIYAHY